MAFSDYRLCDVCGSKTFYDADLQYDLDYFTVNKRNYGLQNLGDWRCICKSCAKTYECVIVVKDKWIKEESK